MTAAHYIVQDFTATGYRGDIVQDDRFRLRYVYRNFSVKVKDGERGEKCEVQQCPIAGAQAVRADALELEEAVAEV